MVCGAKIPGSASEINDYCSRWSGGYQSKVARLDVSMHELFLVNKFKALETLFDDDESILIRDGVR